jgi:hypothetical protein
VVDDLAFAIPAANSSARIDALVVDAGLIQQALGVGDAFRLATNVRITIMVSNTTARSRSIPLHALCIEAARIQITNIYVNWLVLTLGCAAVEGIALSVLAALARD